MFKSTIFDYDSSDDEGFGSDMYSYGNPVLHNQDVIIDYSAKKKILGWQAKTHAKSFTTAITKGIQLD
jgi:hypothetical protein